MNPLSRWPRVYHVLRFIGLCVFWPTVATLACFSIPYWTGLLFERYLDRPSAPYSVLYSWADGIFTLCFLAMTGVAVAVVCMVVALLVAAIGDGLAHLWEKARP
jgi:hypothetical protein